MFKNYFFYIWEENHLFNVHIFLHKICQLHKSKIKRSKICRQTRLRCQFSSTKAVFDQNLELEKLIFTNLEKLPVIPYEMAANQTAFSYVL